MIIPHLNSTCCDHGTSISPSRMCASKLLPDLSRPFQYHDYRQRWSRKLGNQDPHMHFALLTDLPDSREPSQEDNPLVDLCAELIHELNDKYAGQRLGSFFLFHRHRIYNAQERAWMGWERKRGKLLDFNTLLSGQSDRFPVKVGDLRILPRVRFVITLDSDTELPRGSAQRMVGTLAHPLNSAIIDPVKNIVTAGYGILQPRVGVSVQSTARSRLAGALYADTAVECSVNPLL